MSPLAFQGTAQALSTAGLNTAATLIHAIYAIDVCQSKALSKCRAKRRIGLDVNGYLGCWASRKRRERKRLAATSVPRE